MAQATEAGAAPVRAEVEPLVGTLYALMAQIKRVQYNDPVDRASIIALARLAEQGALRLSDLADAVCLDLSTTSRHVRALEDAGMVEREADAADRRAVRLHITPAGREVLATAHRNRAAWLSTVLADWGADDVRAVTSSLQRLADAVTPAVQAGFTTSAR